jgi:hypothetical protein
MTISRAKAGFVMIGVSIFLFLLAGWIDTSETQIGVAWTAFLENCLFIAAFALIGFGIYFAFFSKHCPVCAEQLSPAANDCHYCGHNFDNAARSHHWKWLNRL